MKALSARERNVQRFAQAAPYQQRYGNKILRKMDILSALLEHFCRSTVLILLVLSAVGPTSALHCVPACEAPWQLSVAYLSRGPKRP